MSSSYQLISRRTAKSSGGISRQRRKAGLWPGYPYIADTSPTWRGRERIRAARCRGRVWIIRADALRERNPTWTGRGSAATPRIRLRPNPPRGQLIGPQINGLPLTTLGDQGQSLFWINR